MQSLKFESLKRSLICGDISKSWRFGQDLGSAEAAFCLWPSLESSLLDVPEGFSSTRKNHNTAGAGNGLVEHKGSGKDGNGANERERHKEEEEKKKERKEDNSGEDAPENDEELEDKEFEEAG